VTILEVQGVEFVLGPKGATPKALKRRLVHGAKVTKVRIAKEGDKVKDGVVLVPDKVKKLDDATWAAIPSKTPVMRLANYIHVLGL